MEAAPPSYEKATLVDYWDIVARYIPSSDLCSAALVCSRWHATFAPHLWGNPASHFGVENDRVYVALTRFKRTLVTARLLVRSLTHTLHLPPAHAELYNGPHADWLRDILERLPNLQSLIVRGLPFFDHSALQALRNNRPRTQSINSGRGPRTDAIELPASPIAPPVPQPTTLPTFGLRLLDASRCPNVTSNGLAQALKRFDSLMYLDLSFTYPARDASVLSTLRWFNGLQILKLKGLNLRDQDLEVLAKAVGLRVRSLDVRENGITDRGVRMLLEHCFALRGGTRRGSEMVSPSERSPALLPYLGTEMLEIYQGEDFEGYLRSTFTGNFVSRLAIEDAPEGGVTHLYIANNRLTVEGVSGLVRSGRLHVLDAGSVSSDVVRHPSVSEADEGHSDFPMPGVEKLTPVLQAHGTTSLSFLRLDHSIVTKDTPKPHPEEIVAGRAELSDICLPDLPQGAFELDDTSAVFELPAEQTPRYELAGDPMQIVVSPAMNDHPHTSPAEDDAALHARRGSAFAPEVVDVPSPVDTPTTADIDRTFLLSPISTFDDQSMSPVSPGTGTLPMLPNGLSGRPRSYSSAVTERKARLNAYTSQNHNLHPAMLPHLGTLILIEVPVSTTSKEVSDRLIQFVRICAEEASLAKQQARLDWSLPPGRKGQASALRQSARKIFALKQIVLEMAPAGSGRRHSKASPWQHISTRSMTEDRDSEALWSAAETDFSFFGDDEECGLPSLEPGHAAPNFASNEKEVSFGEPQDSPMSPISPQKEAEPKFDTIALISAFRKDRKAVYLKRSALGGAEVEVEGYWDGVVKVVWPSAGLNGEEELDYYGNRFSSGYLYR